MANTKAFKVKNGIDLAPYASVISDTAIDVFVYDTSNDSDGGAWRKRTQHTSWYNETLNTSTRGSRREFPAIAVIVADADSVQIYDGDDPSLPMWMQYVEGGYTYLAPNTRTTGSMWMLNGILCIPRYSGTGFMHYSSFIDDTARAYSSNTNERRDWRKGIAQRNNTDANLDYNGNYTLEGDNPRSVVMRVLPGAVINSATGLPQPTIAVVGDIGCSIINDIGKVYDIDVSSSDYGDVAFVGPRGVAFSFGQSGVVNQRIGVQNTLPVKDITSVDNTYYGILEYGTSPPFLLASAVFSGPNAHVIVSDNYGFSTATPYYGANPNQRLGVTRVVHDPVDETASMVAYISTNYATGYMNGNTVLSSLSSNSTTNVSGTTLVTNGDFASGTTGWSSGSASTLSVVSGELVVTSTGGNYPSAKQDITVVKGQAYYFSCDIKRGTTSTAVHLEYNDNYGSGWQQVAINSTTTMNTYTGTIVPYSNQIDLRITIYGASIPSGETAIADNIIVKLAENDRCVKGANPQGEALGVFGTVTKTAVATGAELVGYSGWTSSNYLEQPYNSALSFGTGDFTIIVWTKSSGAGKVMLDRLGADQNGLGAGATDTSKRIYIYTGSNEIYGTFGTVTFNTGYTLPTTGWHQLCFTRRNGMVRFYANGKLVSSIANATTIGDTDHITRVGTGITYNTANWGGPIALLRMSADAITGEQIKLAYEHEKALFEANANCTLYGTELEPDCDGIAFDERRNQLHVGTDSGRSVFENLVRVDATNNSVDAGIGASNGFVADD